MSEQESTSLHIALIHYPVVNKNRVIIGSAITNLDVHDIARCARTYGVAKYFIATPYDDQHQLVGELMDHWHSGHGAQYNPARKEALSIVQLVSSMDEIIDWFERQYGKRPLVVTTSAQQQDNSINYVELAEKIGLKEPVLLLFGTAHGLAPDILKESDASLSPIKGGTTYNHLSVRSAVSIIIDRLLGS